MSEIPDDFDFSVVFASLTGTERAVVRRWLEDMEVRPEGWSTVPPLRSLLVSVLMARDSAEILEREDDITSHHDALVAAAQALGAPLGWTPAERVGRRLRSWRKRAGDFLHDGEEEAA